MIQKGDRVRVTDRIRVRDRVRVRNRVRARVRVRDRVRVFADPTWHLFKGIGLGFSIKKGDRVRIGRHAFTAYAPNMHLAAQR